MALSTAAPRPTPLHFGPPEKALFGWYHPPCGPARRSAGIVLCNPIGDDYVRAHRSLRHLAERLSTAGFAVLRFDFHGTGDSSGQERDPGRVPTWIGDVRAAIAELRRRSGAAEVGVVGLRLGATLAMAALAGASAEPPLKDVTGLVLWGPYLDGKSFVTEGTRLQKMHLLLDAKGGPPPQKAPASEGQEVLGFLLTPETIADLGKLDLLKLGRLPALKVMVLSAGDLPGEAKLLDHLRALGAEVEGRHIAGPKFLTMTPHKSVLPEEELEALVAWFSALHPAQEDAAAAPAGGPAHDEATSALRWEEPIVFGGDRPLFGVLVKPPGNGHHADRPVIIMTNAGTVHRIGPHRFYVSMARRWAGLGFHVLRLDLSGIGDSPVGPGANENLCYPPDLMGDMDRAMDMLSQRIGADRFIIMGLCSGGDISFKKGFADRRVVGAVMMNPRTFLVNDLKLVASYQYARHYEKSMFSKESWLKALRGEVDFVRVARRLVPKAADLLRSRALDLYAAMRKLIEQQGQQGQQEQAPDIPACLRRMAERGVDTFLLVAEHDPGVDYVDAHFGKAMRALSGVHGYRREDLKGTNHTFSALWAQQRVYDMITDHLMQRHAAHR